MTKATVLYGHPTNANAFENYYSGTHASLIRKVKGIAKSEFTKFSPNPDGSAPAYYRMAALYFDSGAQMQQTLSSPEGQAMVGDIPNFATGGVTVLFGEVEP